MSSRLSLRMLLARCFEQRVQGNRCRFTFTRGKLRTLRGLLRAPSFSVVLDSVGVPRVSKLALLTGIGRLGGPTVGYVVISTCKSVSGVHSTVGGKTFSFTAGPVSLSSLSQAVRGTVRRIHCVHRSRRRRGRLRSVGGSLTVTKRVRRAVLPHSFPPFPRLARIISVCTSVAPTGSMNNSFCSFFRVSSRHVKLIVTSMSKGKIPTSLFVTIDQALLHTATLQNISSTRYLACTGGLLYGRDLSSVFIAIFCKVCRCGANVVSCAGTKRGPPCLLHNKQAIRYLPITSGFIMNMFSSVRFRDGALAFNVNSALLLCASNIARTFGSGQRRFSRDGLRSVLTSVRRDDSTGRIIADMLRSIGAFSKSCPRSSSVALLSLRQVGWCWGGEAVRGCRVRFMNSILSSGADNSRRTGVMTLVRRKRSITLSLDNYSCMSDTKLEIVLCTFGLTGTGDESIYLINISRRIGSIVRVAKFSGFFHFCRALSRLSRPWGLPRR